MLFENFISQVSRSLIISNKHYIYEFPQEVQNNVKLLLRTSVSQ